MRNNYIPIRMVVRIGFSGGVNFCFVKFIVPIVYNNQITKRTKGLLVEWLPSVTIM